MKRKAKVHIITIDEHLLTGCDNKILIAGVHLSKPTKESLKEYAKEWKTDVGNFKIEERYLQR